MDSKRRKRIFRAVTILTVVAVLGCAGWIMACRLGLSPDYDFGAGAYYYADIPEYEKVLDWDTYQAQLPFWVYVVLFLAWGFFIYRIWKRMDRK